MIFEMAKRLGMPPMDFLDIGGGFSLNPFDPRHNFSLVAPQISEFLSLKRKGFLQGV
jgi:hypothetical protein